ncbi:unnamed protein product [Merluccius merluccius]
MATSTLLILLIVATMATVAKAVEENEVDYGFWNYREGADSVNVATVRSVTRVLDAWGKRIFNEIKTLVHSQPTALLPDYSRVRPLSESVNDLFREVSLLHKRITELNRRLATLEPFLRRHGYREVGVGGKEGEEAAGNAAPPAAQSMRGEVTRLAALYPAREQQSAARAVPSRGSRVVRRRKVRVLQRGGVRVLRSER